jgi:sugar transferase (PEP-CTERM/EpsH1 system associated)
MDTLLFLAHRLPYPPNKGDKIRSFHWLAHLAKRYRVYLGTFVDDAADLHYRSEIERYCEAYCVRPLRKSNAAVGAARAYLRREPLTVGYYRDAVLQSWVTDVVREHGIRRALVFSSAMAQFVARGPAAACGVVADLVDVDSAKWRQYAVRRRWPMSYVFAREGRALLRYERQIAARSSSVLFVTRKERELFVDLAPEAAASSYAVENGVDVDFFSPTRDYRSPYLPGARVLVFTGAMDYWANADAVTWFAEDVFPAVREAIPAAEFHIVGARPLRSVQQLGRIPGVTVSGTVPDVRPYIAHAVAAVAPLRVARGVQNKVLEAFALAKPVVATPAALDALELPPALLQWCAPDAVSFAAACVDALRSDGKQSGAVAREFVLRRYRWEDKVRALEAFIERVVETHAGGARAAAPA